MNPNERSFLILVWVGCLLLGICFASTGTNLILAGQMANWAALATLAVVPPRKGGPARRALVGIVGVLLISFAGGFIIGLVGTLLR